MRSLINIVFLPISLLFMIILLPAFSFAQKTKTDIGKVEIVQDPKVDILVKKHIQINQKQEGIEGFRVQIFNDSGNNSKNQAQAIQVDFKTKYPDIEAYLTYKSPNYRVRVGDFRTRLDAQHFLNEISTDYPNAFITDEQIQLPKDK